MAENFSSFDYKTQEEVLTILKYLTSVLSTTGSQLVEALSPSHLLNQLHDNAPAGNEHAVPELSNKDDQGKLFNISHGIMHNFSVHRSPVSIVCHAKFGRHLYHHVTQSASEKSIQY